MSYWPQLIYLDAKHPAEVVDYPLDFAGWLVGAETLTGTPSVTVDAGITLTPAGKAAPAILGSRVVFWLGGGTHAQTYRLQVAVSTSGGRELVVDASLQVVDPTP